MKKLFPLLSAALLTLGSLSMLPAGAQAQTYSRSTADWSGAYLGLHASGTSHGRNRWYNGATTITLPVHFQGFTGGAIAGYNFQRGALVYGVEADIYAGRSRAAMTTLVPPIACALGCETRVQNLMTLRTRVGYSWNRLMAFATIGVGTASITAETGALGVVARGRGTGISYGGGFEYAMSDNLSVRVHYLHNVLRDLCTGATCHTFVRYGNTTLGVVYRF